MNYWAKPRCGFIAAVNAVSASDGSTTRTGLAAGERDSRA